VLRDEKLLEKVDIGELKIVARRINLRRNPSAKSPSLADAPYNEEFIIGNPATGDEVVRCQRFLKADQVTPAASGLPDPKEINWKGKNYHQLGNKNPKCAHCLAGISTYSDVTE
jgi:hypothetical protein